MAFTTVNGLQQSNTAASGAAGVALELNWDRLGHRYAECINAKGYELDGGTLGAVGDDSNDDTAELQAAIDEAAAQDVPLLIPKGTYKISASLTLPTDIHIIGLGRAAKIKLAASTNLPIFTNSDQVNGNSGIIIENLILDGNLANQDQAAVGDAYSVAYFIKVTDSRFMYLDVSGAYRHGTFGGTVSKRGEGLELIECQRCLVHGGKYHDNIYDGIKLKGGQFNAVSDVLCTDNGRAGVQLYYPDAGTSADGEKRCTLTNIRVRHATGTPSSPSPQTSGVYFHSGCYSTLNGLVCYGTNQGVGAYEGALGNSVTNFMVEHRQGAGDADDYALDLGEDANQDAWGVSNGYIMPISGAAPKLLRLGGDKCEVSGVRFSRGSGTGTGAVQLNGTNHLVHGCVDVDGNVTMTDSSTGSTLADNVGL